MPERHVPADHQAGDLAGSATADRVSRRPDESIGALTVAEVLDANDLDIAITATLSAAGGSQQS